MRSHLASVGMESAGDDLVAGVQELLAQTAFSKRVDYEGETAPISCFPAFVKLRWRGGRSPDAKAYLMAGSNQTGWQ